MALTPRSPLPASILNRPKTGFTVPVRQWLLEAAQLSPKRRQPAAERGLRGWAKMVYAHFAEVALQPPSHGSSHRPPSAGEAPRRVAVTPSSGPRRILVFRIGQLGDTVVALPAMWAVRRRFPDAELTLLCDRHPNKHYVLGADLLRGSGLFQKFEFYPVRSGRVNPLIRAKDRLQLLIQLRRSHFEALVYLSPSVRSPSQIQRDRRFFELAGIRQFIGMNGFTELPRKIIGQPLGAMASEADLLLARLAVDGIPVPRPGEGCMDLNLGAKEDAEVGEWLGTLPTDGAQMWVGIGPGSKQPANRWPIGNYCELVRQLVRRCNIWPVVFGGPEDRSAGDELLRQCGRGYNAAGALSLRGSAQALKQCQFYLGNNTGTMHLAAAVGTRCVSVHSARDQPGNWYPYGPGHQVFRSATHCEGCGLTECVEFRNECLQRITVDQVLAGCLVMLAELAGKSTADLSHVNTNQ